MSDKVKAIVYRAIAAFIVGFFMVALPIVQSTYAAGRASFNAQDFLWALLGGVIAGAIMAGEKVIAPVLLAVLADAGTTGPVLPVTAVPFKDVQNSPAPVPTIASSTDSEISGPAVAPVPLPTPPEPTPLRE